MEPKAMTQIEVVEAFAHDNRGIAWTEEQLRVILIEFYSAMIKSMNDNKCQ